MAGDTGLALPGTQGMHGQGHRASTAGDTRHALLGTKGIHGQGQRVSMAGDTGHALAGTQGIAGWVVWGAAQWSGFPEHGRPVKAGRPWGEKVGLHGELQKLGTLCPIRG